VGRHGCQDPWGLTVAGDGVMYAKTMNAQPATGPLQIQSVVDHVYSALRERILSGDLPRGAKLRQASLADELGVSRTPLREALRRLSAEGLVEFSPNRGATVSELDFGDMRHAWSARVALEPGAARLAAERRHAPAIAAMRAAIADQRAAAGRKIESFAANRAFHLALAAASGNPHLTRFAEMLWVPRLGVPIYQAQAAEPAGPQAWADEHERIADAIAAGNADAAERLTRAHVQAHPPVPPR
jgi:DNA-binding GntR family transcriptional regulator